MTRKTSRELFKELSKTDKKQHRKWFWSHFSKFRWTFILILFASILLVAQGAVIPKLTQLLIDDWLPQSKPLSNEGLRVIIGILLGVFGLVLLKASATLLSSYTIRIFQQNIEIQLKKELYEKILNLKVSYFDSVNEGFFISRMMQDTQKAAEYARFIPENIINIIFSFSINFFFIMTFSWIIGSAIIVFLFLMIISSGLLLNKFRSGWSNIREINDRYSQFLVNSFSGIRETKSFIRENFEKNKNLKISSEYRDTWKKQGFLYGKWTTMNTLFIGSLTTTILAMGSWQVIEGNLTIGQLIALIMYGGLIVEPVNKLLGIYDLFMSGSVSLSRIYSLLNEEEESSKGVNLTIEKGQIEFKNVSLNYASKEHALHNLSFKIMPNEKVAFVGPTGAGKSTILKAIVRFYEINKGQILIDGQDINQVSLGSLRKNITFMSQEPHIFFDTARNNIIYGNQKIDDNEYENVTKKAQAFEFIQDLPNKDDTNIGPRGVSLSGGQKQRIALARAFLKNSKIILFDEATSALDNKTELEIKKSIKKLGINRTSITIAHRLTTIKNADRIFYMEKGRIIEVGSHNQLMKKNNKYKELFDSSSIIE